MGVYDREYYRGDDQPQGFTFGGGQRMLVTNIVILTVAIFLIDAFTTGGRSLSDFLAVHADVYRHPLQLWRLLSYGFAHTPLGKPGGFWHVGINMFMLWMFGRAIEARLGRVEFLLFYLVSIVFSALTWLVMENAWLWSNEAAAQGAIPSMIGASGGVTAVFILFVLYNPKQTLYLWGLLAVPAWAIGAFVIGYDLLRAVGGNTDVAWQAHLGGAAFAFLYYSMHWRLSRLLPAGGRWKIKLPRGGPRLKIHDPEARAQELDAEADRVLDKLHREGEQSLTARERRILENYSRRMRQRRQ